MSELILSRYKSRFDKKKKLDVRGYQWAEVIDLLTTFKVTDNTYAEYKALGSVERLGKKDQGYFIGGEMDPPFRKTFNLQARYVVTLDADHLNFMDELEIKATYGKYTYVVHSSYSHTSDEPRLRISFPVTRPVTPEEYEPLARKIAEMWDMEVFDDTTYQFSRVMFLPARASDGEEYTEVNDGEWIDPDQILSLYEDSEDVGSWPRSSRQKMLRAPTLQAQNPFDKPGIIGEFNRAYSIDEAIIKFGLPYTESGQGDGRYSYLDGTSADGAIYYPDDGHLFSHHESDPASGNHNAFDLVRLHKWADDTEGAANVMSCPSMQRMVQLASDPAQCPEVTVERAGSMFDDCSAEAEADEQANQAEGPEIPSVPAQPQIAEAKAITVLSILELIDGFSREHDTTILEQSNRLLTELALAALPDHETDICLQTFIGYANLGGKTGLTKAGMKKSLKELTKALVARKGEGGQLIDIQVEFLDKFLTTYYLDGKHLRRTGRQFWIYRGTHWARRSDEYIQGQLLSLLSDLRTNATTRKESRELAAAVGESQTSTIFSSLWSMFLARMTCATESTYNESDPMGLMRTGLPKRINCLNGTIEFRDDGKYRLRKADAEDLFTSVVEAEFDREAACPTWDLYCRDSFSRSSDPRAVQRHLEEVIGYTLNQSRHLRAWVLLYGGTGSGKSTVGEVLGFMLGDAAKFMPFSNYGGNNSHATAGLIGKQMVFDDDYKAGDLLPDGILKTISEEKRLEANPKGKEEFAFVARCVPYICTNNAPTTKDSSGALADRAMVFPFDHLIPFNERDSEMKDKLKAEANGILARCAEAFSRLVKRKRWEFPADCTTAWRKWINQSNTINGFIEECLIEAPGEHVKALDVWGAYRLWWLEETGNSNSSVGRHKTGFYTALEQALEQTRVRHSKDAMIWRGYKLAPKYIISEDFDD